MKKLSILIFSLLSLCTYATFGQTYQWAIGEGGVSEDRAFGTATDNSGNVYVTGYFRSTASFGSVTLNNYSSVEDIFLVKYDSAGNLLWAKQFGGLNSDIAYDVATDNDGNCYVTGTFYNEATFGAFTLESTGSFDYEAFVFKTNSAGTVLWAKHGGGVGFDESRGLAITTDKLYITGLYTGSATFGASTVTAAGSVDVYVACYNLNGVVQWVTSGGGTGFDFGLGLASDASGNAFVTGYFQGTATFGTSVLTNSSSAYIDMFVFKINSSGNILWAHSGGTGADDDAGRAIATDNAGNIYVAGELRGSGQFDGISYTSAGIADMYVAKYDASGTIQYLTQAGNQGGDYAYGIAAGSSRVYVTGLFNGIVQFGTTTLTSAGSFGPISNDIYLATMDANSGSFISAMRAGGNGDDAGRAVAIDYTGAVVQAGDFEHSNSTFDPFILNSNGTHDMFAARIGSSCVSPTVSISAAGATTFCNGESATLTSSVTGSDLTYQWKKNGVDISGASAGSYVATTSGSYSVSVSNACGNPVSNTISVTVKKNPKVTVSPSGTVSMCSGDQTVLTASAGNNMTYQWMKNGININGATNNIYTATLGGKYSVKVMNTSTGCFRVSAITKVKITCKTIDPREISSRNVIQVYPNPTAGEFMIRLDDGNSYDVQISDALGRILKSYTHVEGSLSFGNDLKPGMYLLLVNLNNSQVEVIKLIKTAQ